MGAHVFRTITVIAYFIETGEIARRKAKRLKLHVSEGHETLHNGFYTFCVFTTGAKLSWDEYNKYNAKQDKFVEYLKKKKLLYTDTMISRSYESYNKTHYGT